jgi:catechol 2,3-dioxygenase-like lactoylglutathione lyase family enzyme
VIAGVHTIIYAEDAEKARVFFRDVLGFASVDAGRGWLIFELPPGELAFHPTEGPGHHDLFLMCHDIERTVQELQAKGVEFVSPISDARFGRLTSLKIPGAGEVSLYEPNHASPLTEFSSGD